MDYIMKDPVKTQLHPREMVYPQGSWAAWRQYPWRFAWRHSPYFRYGIWGLVTVYSAFLVLHFKMKPYKPAMIEQYYKDMEVTMKACYKMRGHHQNHADHQYFHKLEAAAKGAKH